MPEDLAAVEVAALARGLADLYARLADLDGRRSELYRARARRSYRLAVRAEAVALDGYVEIGTYPSLTPRETEVAMRVAEGLTNREIAARLFIAPRTVESHIERIFEKMQVSKRAAVAAAVAAWVAGRIQVLSAYLDVFG